MKVKDLIKKLNKMPQDLELIIDVFNNGGICEFKPIHYTSKDEVYFNGKTYEDCVVITNCEN